MNVHGSSSVTTQKEVALNRGWIVREASQNLPQGASEMVFINNVTATEYLEIGQSEQRNQKGRLIELKDLID
jgi:hypothetical protein